MINASAAREVILFQGDSITDTGRNREVETDRGKGYMLIASSLYGARFPDRQTTFWNRGCGGHTVKALRDRWQRDCIDLQPTLVSILVGINDNVMAGTENKSNTIEEFAAVYRELLEQTKTKLGARLLIIEPFLLPNRADYELWRADVNLRIEVTRALARDYHATYIPMDGILAQACTRADAAYWSHDGVHLTPAGHALLAKAWLNAVCGEKT